MDGRRPADGDSRSSRALNGGALGILLALAASGLAVSRASATAVSYVPAAPTCTAMSGAATIASPSVASAPTHVSGYRICGPFTAKAGTSSFDCPLGSRATGPYRLLVRNGDAGGSARASSAVIRVDGVEVLGQRTFDAQTSAATARVPLAAANTIETVINDRGGILRLEVVDEGQVCSILGPTDVLAAGFQRGISSGNAFPVPEFQLFNGGLGGSSPTNKGDVSFNGALLVSRKEVQEKVTAVLAPLALAPPNTLSASAGERGLFSVQVVDRDQTPPQFTIQNPADGSFSNKPQIPVSGTTDDPSASVVVNGSAATSSGGKYSGQANLVECWNTIVVRAADVCENVSQATVRVGLDTVPTVLAIVAPPAGLVTNRAVQTVALRYSDNFSGVDLSSLRLYLDGNDVTGILSIGPDTATGSLTLAEGRHTLHAQVSDRAGNSSAQDSSFLVDLTPPLLAVAAPRDGDLTPSSTSVEITYSDAVSSVDVSTFVASLDGQDVSSRFAIGPESASSALSLAPGAHLLEVQVSDLAANVVRTHSSFLVVNADTILPAGCGGFTTGVAGIGDASSASGTVGPSGGTVSLSGGAALEFPPGALTATTTITIQRMGQAVNCGGQVLRFLPDGISFARPATVRFPVPASVTKPTIYWTAAGGEAKFEPQATAVSGSTASAQVSHFSWGYVGPTALSSIAVTTATPSVPTDGTAQFTATGRYADGTTQDISSQVTWASSMPAVATVDAYGLATPLSAGTTSITATLGNVSGSTRLAVHPAKGAAPNPPVLAVYEPPPAFALTSPLIVVSGSATGGTPPLVVTVNGLTAPLAADGKFSTMAGVPTGPATINVQIRDASGSTVSQAVSGQRLVAATNSGGGGSSGGSGGSTYCVSGTALGIAFTYDPAGNLTQVVDTLSDANNCGCIGNSCPSTSTGQGACQQGICGLLVSSIGAGSGGGGTQYINTTWDTANCGSVGNVCPSIPNGIPSCMNGACGIDCGSGDLVVAGTCVNPLTDPMNCGYAGHVCPGSATGSAVCVQGTCVSGGVPSVSGVNGVPVPGTSFRVPAWAGLTLTGANLQNVTWIEFEEWGTDTIGADYWPSSPPAGKRSTPQFTGATDWFSQPPRYPNLVTWSGTDGVLSARPAEDTNPLDATFGTGSFTFTSNMAAALAHFGPPWTTIAGTSVAVVQVIDSHQIVISGPSGNGGGWDPGAHIPWSFSAYDNYCWSNCPIAQFTQKTGSLTIPGYPLLGFFNYWGPPYQWYKMRLHYKTPIPVDLLDLGPPAGNGFDGTTDSSVLVDFAISFDNLATVSAPAPRISGMDVIKEFPVGVYDPATGLIATGNNGSGCVVPDPAPFYVLGYDAAQTEYPILSITCDGIYIAQGLDPNVTTHAVDNWYYGSYRHVVTLGTSYANLQAVVASTPDTAWSWSSGGVLLRGSGLFNDGPVYLVNSADGASCAEAHSPNNVLPVASGAREHFTVTSSRNRYAGAVFLGDRLIVRELDYYSQPAPSCLEFDSARGAAITPWPVNWGVAQAWFGAPIANPPQPPAPPPGSSWGSSGSTAPPATPGSVWPAWYPPPPSPGGAPGVCTNTLCP